MPAKIVLKKGPSPSRSNGGVQPEGKHEALGSETKREPTRNTGTVKCFAASTASDVLNAITFNELHELFIENVSKLSSPSLQNTQSDVTHGALHHPKETKAPVIIDHISKAVSFMLPSFAALFPSGHDEKSVDGSITDSRKINRNRNSDLVTTNQPLRGTSSGDDNTCMRPASRQRSAAKPPLFTKKQPSDSAPEARVSITIGLFALLRFPQRSHRHGILQRLISILFAICLQPWDIREKLEKRCIERLEINRYIQCSRVFIDDFSDSGRSGRVEAQPQEEISCSSSGMKKCDEEVDRDCVSMDIDEIENCIADIEEECARTLSCYFQQLQHIHNLFTDLHGSFLKHAAAKPFGASLVARLLVGLGDVERYRDRMILWENEEAMPFLLATRRVLLVPSLQQQQQVTLLLRQLINGADSRVRVVARMIDDEKQYFRPYNDAFITSEGHGYDDDMDGDSTYKSSGEHASVQWCIGYRNLQKRRFASTRFGKIDTVAASDPNRHLEWWRRRKRWESGKNRRIVGVGGVVQVQVSERAHIGTTEEARATSAGDVTSKENSEQGAKMDRRLGNDGTASSRPLKEEEESKNDLRECTWEEAIGSENQINKSLSEQQEAGNGGMNDDDGDNFEKNFAVPLVDDETTSSDSEEEEKKGECRSFPTISSSSNNNNTAKKALASPLLGGVEGSEVGSSDDTFELIHSARMKCLLSRRSRHPFENSVVGRSGSSSISGDNSISSAVSSSPSSSPSCASCSYYRNAKDYYESALRISLDITADDADEQGGEQGGTKSNRRSSSACNNGGGESSSNSVSTTVTALNRRRDEDVSLSVSLCASPAPSFVDNRIAQKSSDVKFSNYSSKANTDTAREETFSSIKEVYGCDGLALAQLGSVAEAEFDSVLRDGSQVIRGLMLRKKCGSSSSSSPETSEEARNAIFARFFVSHSVDVAFETAHSYWRSVESNKAPLQSALASSPHPTQTSWRATTTTTTTTTKLQPPFSPKSSSSSSSKPFMKMGADHLFKFIKTKIVGSAASEENNNSFEGKLSGHVRVRSLFSDLLMPFKNDVDDASSSTTTNKTDTPSKAKYPQDSPPTCEPANSNSKRSAIDLLNDDGKRKEATARRFLHDSSFYSEMSILTHLLIQYVELSDLTKKTPKSSGGRQRREESAVEETHCTVATFSSSPVANLRKQRKALMDLQNGLSKHPLLVTWVQCAVLYFMSIGMQRSPAFCLPGKSTPNSCVVDNNEPLFTSGRFNVVGERPTLLIGSFPGPEVFTGGVKLSLETLLKCTIKALACYELSSSTISSVTSAKSGRRGMHGAANTAAPLTIQAMLMILWSIGKIASGRQTKNCKGTSSSSSTQPPFPSISSYMYSGYVDGKNNRCDSFPNETLLGGSSNTCKRDENEEEDEATVLLLTLIDSLAEAAMTASTTVVAESFSDEITRHHVSEKKKDKLAGGNNDNDLDNSDSSFDCDEAFESRPKFTGGGGDNAHRSKRNNRNPLGYGDQEESDQKKVLTGREAALLLAKTMDFYTPSLLEAGGTIGTSGPRSSSGDQRGSRQQNIESKDRKPPSNVRSVVDVVLEKIQKKLAEEEEEEKAKNKTQKRNVKTRRGASGNETKKDAAKNGEASQILSIRERPRERGKKEKRDNELDSRLNRPPRSPSQSPTNEDSTFVLAKPSSRSVVLATLSSSPRNGSGIVSNLEEVSKHATRQRERKGENEKDEKEKEKEAPRAQTRAKRENGRNNTKKKDEKGVTSGSICDEVKVSKTQKKQKMKPNEGQIMQEGLTDTGTLLTANGGATPSESSEKRVRRRRRKGNGGGEKTLPGDVDDQACKMPVAAGAPHDGNGTIVVMMNKPNTDDITPNKVGGRDYMYCGSRDSLPNTPRSSSSSSASSSASCTAENREYPIKYDQSPALSLVPASDLSALLAQLVKNCTTSSSQLDESTFERKQELGSKSETGRENSTPFLRVGEFVRTSKGEGASVLIGALGLMLQSLDLASSGAPSAIQQTPTENDSAIITSSTTTTITKRAPQSNKIAELKAKIDRRISDVGPLIHLCCLSTTPPRPSVSNESVHHHHHHHGGQATPLSPPSILLSKKDDSEAARMCVTPSGKSTRNFPPTLVQILKRKDTCNSTNNQALVGAHADTLGQQSAHELNTSTISRDASETSITGGTNRTCSSAHTNYGSSSGERCRSPSAPLILLSAHTIAQPTPEDHYLRYLNNQLAFHECRSPLKLGGGEQLPPVAFPLKFGIGETRIDGKYSESTHFTSAGKGTDKRILINTSKRRKSSGVSSQISKPANIELSIPFGTPHGDFAVRIGRVAALLGHAKVYLTPKGYE